MGVLDEAVLFPGRKSTGERHKIKLLALDGVVLVGRRGGAQGHRPGRCDVAADVVAAILQSNVPDR